MMDAAVTVLSVADALQYVPTNRVLDGVDLMPVLKEGGQPARKPHLRLASTRLEQNLQLSAPGVLA